MINTNQATHNQKQNHKQEHNPHRKENYQNLRYSTKINVQGLKNQLIHITPLQLQIRVENQFIEPKVGSLRNGIS